MTTKHPSEQRHPRKWVAGGSDNEHRHSYRGRGEKGRHEDPTAQSCRPRIKESNWSCGLELNRHRVNNHGNPHDHRPTDRPVGKPSVDNSFDRAHNVRDELGAGKQRSRFLHRLNPKLHAFN